MFTIVFSDYILSEHTLAPSFSSQKLHSLLQFLYFCGHTHTCTHMFKLVEYLMFSLSLIIFIP